MPWERPVSQSDDDVPWVAVLPFDCAHPTDPELNVSQPQLADISKGLFEQKTVPLDAQFSMPMTALEYAGLEAKVESATSKKQVIIPPMKLNGPTEEATPVQVIFLKGKLFRKLFYTEGKLDLLQFKYCAHVRSINTEGITGAVGSDSGSFGIVHSRRSGPTDITAASLPRSQAVHVVSLEGLDGFEVPDSDDVLVGLLSLHRWTYLCEPPLSINFIDCMLP